jgi:hypothetical protein
VIDAARATFGLRRIATGLIAYGVVGLIVAVIGLGVLLGTADRIGKLSSGVASEVERMGRILERTATALDEASDTASSFGTTIDRTGPTVRQAASAVRAIVPRMRDLEAQANAINIFGSLPLAPLGQLFGEIATELDGLDGQLDGIAAELAANRSVLDTNAASLGALATEVRFLAERLPEASQEEPLVNVQVPLMVAIGLLVVWAGVPAAGALALGIWLRRLIPTPRVDIVPTPAPPPAD